MTPERASDETLKTAPEIEVVVVAELKETLGGQGLVDEEKRDEVRESHDEAHPSALIAHYLAWQIATPRSLKLVLPW